MFPEDRGSTPTLFDRLFRMNAECFRKGAYDAGYHVLYAAMMVAHEHQNISDLDRVIALANHQGDGLDRVRPVHPLSRGATLPHGLPSAHELLITRATSARAMAVTRTFLNRPSGQPAPPVPRGPPPEEAPFEPGSNRSASMCARLLDFSRDCFRDGAFEGSYHLLMAALHTAEGQGKLGDLEQISILATQQADVIEKIVPPHRLSRLMAQQRSAYSLYDLLISRSDGARAKMTTRRFRASGETKPPHSQDDDVESASR
jgi:hypothetical protein